MDWYFLLMIVAFFVIGIGLIAFALQGPSATSSDESAYNELMNAQNDFHQSNTSQLVYSMPLPPDDIECESAPQVSLTSPYPRKPPPLGFNVLPVTSHTEVNRPSPAANPYPSDEEISRMPNPTNNSLHSRLHIQQPNQRPLPSQTRQSSHTTFATNTSVYPHIDMASENPDMPELPIRHGSSTIRTRDPATSNILRNRAMAQPVRHQISDSPPPPYSEAVDNRRPSKRNRPKKRLSQ